MSANSDPDPIVETGYHQMDTDRKGKAPLSDIIPEEDIECDDEPTSSLASMPVESQLKIIKLQDKPNA